MRLAIIASRFVAYGARTVEDNIAYARLCVRHSFDLGEAPFAAHLLYTQPTILDDGVPSERQRGMQACYEWMKQADVVAFYVDHGWSKGMLDELRVARIWHKEIDIRTIYSPVGEHPDDVASLLSEAGLIEAVESPIPGIRAYRFIPKGD